MQQVRKQLTECKGTMPSFPGRPVLFGHFQVQTKALFKKGQGQEVGLFSEQICCASKSAQGNEHTLQNLTDTGSNPGCPSCQFQIWGKFHLFMLYILSFLCKIM